MIGVTVVEGGVKPEVMAIMDSRMLDWTLRAARGECGWVCADCCQSFSEGMPDACCHGHESCTSIIKRDKELAHAK